MRWILTPGLPRPAARGLLRGAKSTLRLSAAAPGRSARVAAAGAALLMLGALACREASRPELGAAQYREYCASCHGAIAPGGAVTGRKPDAPDLTALAARFGSPLRRDELAAFIDGRRDVLAHGTRDMPVWGARLYESYPQTPGTEAVRGGTVELLVDYLESVQRR
jgi:mono/diheme cytochrome c family protein